MDNEPSYAELLELGNKERERLEARVAELAKELMPHRRADARELTLYSLLGIKEKS
jgi:hypothetical protein